LKLETKTHNHAAIEREFTFTDQHFNILRSLVNKHTGIKLSDSKRELVYGRLARRLRSLGLTSFDPYCRLLKTDPDTELVNFVNAITTNKTDFFRESHHFDFLCKKIIPDLLGLHHLSRRLRIWSAGCSTGEEPYCIAMMLMESIPNITNWDVKILATDIDSNVLLKAERGVYNQETMQGVSKARRIRWFKKGKGENAKLFCVSPQLKQLITFKQLNLMNDWPMRGPFDLLFCRNVVIYFDKQTQAKLFDRYADIMADYSYLFIGHSESLYSVTDRFEHLGQTIHRKIA